MKRVARHIAATVTLALLAAGTSFGQDESLPNATQVYRQKISPLELTLNFLLRTPEGKAAELVDEQLLKLRELDEELRRESVRILREWSAARGEGNFVEQIEQTAAKIDKELDEVLLPFQRDHVRKAVLQRSIQTAMRYGYGGYGAALDALTGDQAVKLLGLSDQQLRELREIMRNAEAESRQVNREYHEEGIRHVLETLTDQQRAEYHKLIGPPIKQAGHEN